MPSVDKLIEKMKKQPKGVRPEEADKVLSHIGFNAVRQRSSHKIYKNGYTGKILSVPQKNPVNEVYISQILEELDKLR